MKIILSGSSGFLGSAVGTHFLNSSTDPKHGVHKDEIRTIPRDMLNDRWGLQRFFEEEKPDYILHFSAYGNHSFQKDLDETILANLQHLSNLLNASKSVDYKLFVNTSTSSIFLPNQTFYSSTKKCGQDICEIFAKENSKRIVSIQPLSVYGPGEAPFRFIPTVIQSALKGEFFNLVEEPSHDWLYIDDFVSGLETVMNTLTTGNVAIGTGTQYTNKEVVEIIEQIHQSKVWYNKVESLRSYDTENWEVNVDRIYHLGWKPEFSLYKGLLKVYEKYAHTQMAQ